LLAPFLSSCAPQLDNLGLSEQQKRDMSGSVQTAAVAGIQGAVWGSLVLALLFLLIFNFARTL
jgi:hypothetical protein